MNIKTINIGNPEKALENLIEIKNKNYGNVDIKIGNLHLKRINELVRKNVFKKNDAFINAETLWEVMQPVGEKNHHHFHNLTTENVLETLKTLSNPYCVLQTESNRLSILSTYEKNGKRLVTIIEIDTVLLGLSAAKINKIITIYPKDRINNYIRGKTVLYLKP